MKNSQVFMLTGGILILLTGIIILVAGWMGASYGGILGVLVGMTAGAIGMSQVITGLIIIFASSKHQRSTKWAIVGFISSLIALLSGGGFFIGALLALLGSVLGIVEGGKRQTRQIIKKVGAKNARKKTSKRSKR